MGFTIERRQPYPRGQKVGAVRRDTAREGLDRVDPRPATPVDSFGPLVARPNPLKQVRKFTGESRVALPQFVSKGVTLGRDLRVMGGACRCFRMSRGGLLLRTQLVERTVAA